MSSQIGHIDKFKAKRHQYFAETTCPACNLLPLEELYNENTPSPPPISILPKDLGFDHLSRYKKDCDLCRLVFDLYEHWRSDGSEEQLRSDGIMYKALCGRNDWRIRHTDHTYLSMSVDWNSIAAKRVDVRYIHADPLSDLSVGMIRWWMSKCEKKHDACFNHSKDLPTRVIDVREPRLRLLDPSPKGDHQYVALSHCWGTCRSFLTTRDNLDLRREGFKFEELPATFQDAVQVTRKLGISFLWIDSICILQGDKDDWEIEGSKMADVYSNATLTIAAANASDDAEGFLKPRKELKSIKVDITLPAQRPNESDKVVRVYTHLRPKFQLYYDPLNGRAWCLQERYLSPRLLFFDSNALRWECLGNRWFEAGRKLPGAKLMLPDVMPDSLDNGGRSHLPWYNMVEQYTTRAITYHSDKLPAVSALAARVAQSTGDEYLAGLWKSDFVRGLVWNRHVRRKFRENEPVAPFERPDSSKIEYLAPSWSWASYAGAVQFQAGMPAGFDMEQLPSVRILDVSVTVPGKNHFGQIQFGYLDILSPVLSFGLAAGDGMPIVGAWDHDRLFCYELEDFDVSIESMYDYLEKEPEQSILGIPLTLSKYRDTQEHEAEELDLGSHKGTDPIGDEALLAKVYGVLIIEIAAEGEVIYQRIGCFTIRMIQLRDFLDLLRFVQIGQCRIV